MENYVPNLLLAYDNHLCNESQHGFVMSSLSRLYSFFGVGEELSKLSGLIATAEGHMQNEDFESAVRVLNQTNGEPHRIFSKVRFLIQFLYWS